MKMSNGHRNMAERPLSDDEIKFVKTQIKRIHAHEDMFVFNDPEHIIETCYNSEYGCVFVGTNVFPDEVYAGTSAKDKLTVAAVLAHEFYGHGPNRIMAP